MVGDTILFFLTQEWGSLRRDIDYLGISGGGNCIMALCNQDVDSRYLGGGVVRLVDFLLN